MELSRGSFCTVLLVAVSTMASVGDRLEVLGLTKFTYQYIAPRLQLYSPSSYRKSVPYRSFECC